MLPRWIAGGNGPFTRFRAAWGRVPEDGTRLRTCSHCPRPFRNPHGQVPARASASRSGAFRGPGGGMFSRARKGSRGVRIRFRVGSRRRNRFELLQIRLGKCVFTPRAARSEHGRVWQRSFFRAPIGSRGRRCRGSRPELPRPQAKCRCRAAHRRVCSRSPQPRSCG